MEHIKSSRQLSSCQTWITQVLLNKLLKAIELLKMFFADSQRFPSIQLKDDSRKLYKTKMAGNLQFTVKPLIISTTAYKITVDLMACTMNILEAIQLADHFENVGAPYDALTLLSRVLDDVPKHDFTIRDRVRILLKMAGIHLNLNQLFDAAATCGEIPDGVEFTIPICPDDIIERFIEEGVSSLENEDFEKAFTYFNAARKVAVRLENQEIGCFGLTLAVFKRDKKPLSYLNCSLKKHYTTQVFAKDMIKLWLKVAKKKAAIQQIDEQIDAMKISKAIYDASIEPRNDHLEMKIRKGLAIELFKKKKTKDAIAEINHCIKLSPRFLKDLWESNEKKILKEEKSNNPAAAIERMRFFSFLSVKFSKNSCLQSLEENLITLSFKLYSRELGLKSYDGAFEAMENIAEFLKENEIKREDVAQKLKEAGNVFTKKKDFEHARLLYTYALSILPADNINLERNLLSNKSYMSELLGDFEKALADAKKCVALCPKWSKSHFRLGRSHYFLKQFCEAHKAFQISYNFADPDMKPDVLKNILINIGAITNKQLQESMEFPVETETLNNSIIALCKEKSSSALNAIVYIFSQPKFSSNVSAKQVPLIEMIKRREPADLIKRLLEAGADPNFSNEDISPLEFAIDSTECEINTILHLIEYNASVTKYVPEKEGNEPPPHTVLRIVFSQGKMSLLERMIESADIAVTDEDGNTFLHVLAKEKCTPGIVNCMKSLTSSCKIDPNSKNKFGSKAADLIVDQNDERKAILGDYKATFKATHNRGKSKKRKKQNTKIKQSATPGHLNPIKKQTSVPNESVNVSRKRKEVKDIASNKAYNDNTYEQVVGNIADYMPNFVNVDVSVSAVTGDRHTTIEQQNSATDTTDTSAVSLISSQGTSQADHVSDETEDYTGVNYIDEEDFDGLSWDVQCTAEFWKKLQDKKLELFLKKEILRKIKLLASGDWRSNLAIRLKGPWNSNGIRLFEAKLNKGARILWEEAVAFSERRSENQHVYSDVIRVWDFTLQHDEVSHLIERIVRSKCRGQTCAIKKQLHISQNQLECKDKIRVPKLYVLDLAQNSPEIIESLPGESRMDDSTENVLVYNASCNEKEFHILKFYALTNAMANSLLNISDQNLDFPFQVSELEHEIIRLQTSASILLLGRSGTGKTTCCLYRLWSKFKIYWDRVPDAGPHIPNLFRQCIEDATSNEELQENLDSDNGTSARSYACGCKDVCMCVVAASKIINREVSSANEVLDTSSSSQQSESASEDSDTEAAVQSESEEEDQSLYRHLRQMFITKNKVLCHEVKRNFQDLCHASPNLKENADFLAQQTFGNLNDIDGRCFPLFLGSRDLLLMLDATLPGKSFFLRDSSGKMVNQLSGWGENENHLSFLPVLDSDDEEEQDDDDKHFSNVTKPSGISRQISIANREVTYQVFANELWPSIEKKFKSGYHPSLVWTEICSFIKGTAQALISKHGYIDKDAYNAIGRKKAPNFAGDRETVYKIFEMYHKMSRAKGMFDEFDVLFNLYNRLRKNPVERWLFDEIYVDETQDFTEAELFLLIYCCSNPNHLFFTGDTAQSIMRGVTFRFSDLRSLFFNASDALCNESGSSNNVINVPDKVYQLTYNYRSHKGILDLASSVVDLLSHFFPESFDRLSNDIGLFDGPKPVILETSDFADLAILLRGAQRKTSAIEFGAHQVVLVSSEERKQDLPEELNCALVLSIYEAKGLEFDDVLLYNFFKDSQAEEEWRLIQTYSIEVEGNVLADSSSTAGLVTKMADDLENKRPPLKFESSKHKILNSELKQLYTALTRARVNVWIYDEDREKRQAMFDYFKRNDLVGILKLGDDKGVDAASGRGIFDEGSNAEEWERQGKFFYKKELWQAALKCFQKTEDKVMMERCAAHLKALEAYKMAMKWQEERAGSLKNLQLEYLRATEMYLKCGMAEESMICLKNAKHWKLLAEFCQHLERHHDAGRYFAKANEVVRASDSYKKCGDFRSAMDLLYQNKRYRECVSLLNEYKHARLRNQAKIVQPPRTTLTLEKVCVEAAEQSFRRKKYEDMKAFLEHLSVDEQLRFLKKKPNCEEIEIRVLVENGRQDEVAKVFMDKGEYDRALLYAKDPNIKGLCHLEEARLLYTKWKLEHQRKADSLIGDIQDVPDGLLSDLDNCVDLLSEDDTNLADAYLMKMMVRYDVDQGSKAINLFVKGKNSFAALLCKMHLLEKDDLTTDIAVLGLHDFLEFSFALLSNRMPISICQTFFGIEKDSSSDESNIIVNESMLRYRLTFLEMDGRFDEIKSCYSDKGEMSGNLSLIDVMLSVAGKLEAKLRECYESELQATEICHKSLTEVPHSDCVKQHGSPDSEASQRRLNAWFAIIQLDSIIRKAYNSIKSKDKEITNIFEKHLAPREDQIMIQHCHVFYEEFLDLTWYLLPGKFSGQTLSKCVPEMPFLKEQILWYVGHIWHLAGNDGKYGDVDLFLEISVLSNLISVSFSQTSIDEIRRNIMKRTKDPKSIPFTELTVYNKRRVCLETFHTIFDDSKKWLHEEGALVESVHHFLRRCINIPLLSYKTVPLPDLLNVITLLEYNTSICLLSMSKCLTWKTESSEQRMFYIPAFYIEGIDLWSHLYTRSKNYSAIQAVDYVHELEGFKLLSSLLAEIVDLLLMRKYARLDMFQTAMEQQGLKCRSYERLLILVLVLLSNPFLVPTVQQSGKDLLSKLIKYYQPQKGVEYIQDALKKIPSIRQEKDARNVLEDVLKIFGNKLIRSDWSSCYGGKAKTATARASKSVEILKRENISAEPINNVEMGIVKPQNDDKNLRLLAGILSHNSSALHAQNGEELEGKTKLDTEQMPQNTGINVITGISPSTAMSERFQLNAAETEQEDFRGALDWQISCESDKTAELDLEERLPIVQPHETEATEEIMNEDDYDDPGEYIQDSSEYLLARNNNRHDKQNGAACSIQRWWRQLILNKTKSRCDERNDDNLDAYQQCFDGLHCLVCGGNSFSDKRHLEDHLLNDPVHASKVDAYKTFKLEESKVNILLQQCEEILDRDIANTGQKVSQLEKAKELCRSMGDVPINLNFVKQSRRWNETQDLCKYVRALRTAYQSLDREIKCINEGEVTASRDDDEFQLVTNRRKKKNWKPPRHSSKNKGTRKRK